MNEKPRQAKSIRAQLLTAMREGEYAHCDRLPRESVLSERLGISRTQLRDILASLDREGFITLLEEAAAGKKRLEAIDKSFERRTFEVL